MTKRQRDNVLRLLWHAKIQLMFVPWSQNGDSTQNLVLMWPTTIVSPWCRIVARVVACAQLWVVFVLIPRPPYLYLYGRKSLYSTSGVQVGVGSWKLLVWNVRRKCAQCEEMKCVARLNNFHQIKNFKKKFTSEGSKSLTC